MGTYINLKLADPSKAAAINDRIQELPEYEQLAEAHAVPVFEERVTSGYSHPPGVTQLKVSRAGVGPEVKQLWADLFDTLHEEFDIIIFRSHLFDAEYEYLRPDHRMAITDDGDARTDKRMQLFNHSVPEGRERVSV